MGDTWKVPRNPNNPLYPLRAPARYPLSVCLEELRWGRPAAEQRWLNDRIAELRAYGGMDADWEDSPFGEASRDADESEPGPGAA